MYDPSDGRWLTQDPIGFDAGDTDLYRYVTNDPTNEIDPLGTVGRAIRNKDDIKSHVYFKIGGGVLHRTAPAGAGEYYDGATDDLRDMAYGYYSFIRVNGDPTVTNSCNTPFQLFPTNFDTNGGAVALHLKDLSSGAYDVKVRIKVTAGVKLATPKLPSFNVYQANDDRENWKQLWTPTWKLIKPKKGSMVYTASAETTLTVRLNFTSGLLSSSSDSLLLVPSFSFTGNNSEFMYVAMQILVLEIKKVN